MRVVLDTNVVVSGLLSAHGPPGRILDLLLAGELTLVVDDRLLDEYWEVLGRPRFGFERADVEAFLSFLRAESAAVLAAPLAVVLPDPDDVPFVEVAVAGAADVLVTGNLAHFPVERLPAGLTVLSPAGFLTAWKDRTAGR